MSIPLEAVVGELHIIGGVRQSVTLPTAALVAPRRAARGRAGDTLFALLELRGPAPLPYQALMDCIEAAYWRTPGTVTSALRAAVTAANSWLMDHNVQATVASRFHAGVSCAVLREADVFIAQAGPAVAYVAHHGQVERFPASGMVTPAMGISRGVEVRFSRASLSPGDTLLLCDSATAERTPEETVARAIVYTGVEAALQNLEKLADGSDLIALVVESAAEARTKAAIAAAVSPPREAQAVPAAAPAGPAPPPEPQPEVETAQPAPRIGWAQRAGRWVAQPKVRERVWAIGGSLAAGLAVAARGLATILQRTLPDRAVAPRPRGKGADAPLIGIALLLPIAVSILVAAAYIRRSDSEQFNGLLSGADAQARQAATLKDPSARRASWASALEQAQSALAMQPNSAEARRLRDEAQRALDQLDNVVRLAASQMWNFKSPGPHRLATQGSALYVLDRSLGRVFQLTLNESGDGVTDRGEQLPVRVYSQQNVGDRQVGNLIDLVWMPAGGTRTRSSLLVLDSGGLLDYDPAWNIRPVSLGQGPVPTGARVAAAFGGNLYVLDAGANQVWRYKPQGDGYAGAAEGYFDKPAGDLSNVIDMAIDGNIYLLHANGRIRKFFGGEEKAFAASGMADPIKRPVALTVDAESKRGGLYVADAGASRIVQLNTDGALVRQIRVTGDAFDALEDLSVDERNARLYVTSGGKLYAIHLPATP